MGLFDRVRQVLAKVEKVLPGTDRAADEPRPQKRGAETTPESTPETTPETTEEELPTPGTAQPAQEPTSAAQTSAPASSLVEEPAASDASDASDASAAAHAPATPVAEPRRYRTHTLLPGQSLADVADQHGVSAEDVAELNGVDPELVFAGQVFRIPHD